jgi:DNA-binding NarL/FixJ family response regulator
MLAVSVLLIDDHELLAQTLALALRAEGLVVEAPPVTSPEAVLAAAERVHPDLVLLDLDLGAMGSGVSLVAPLLALGAEVVILSGATDALRLAEGIEAGASAWVSKAAPFPQLLGAVRAAAGGAGLLSATERSDLLVALQRRRAEERARLAPFERLTPRERQVLAALVAGRPAEGIAKDLVVSLATVRSQIRSLLLKLGVHSQLAAVAMARCAGWPGG